MTRPLAVSSETSGENAAVVASGTHVAQKASTPVRESLPVAHEREVGLGHAVDADGARALRLDVGPRQTEGAGGDRHAAVVAPQAQIVLEGRPLGPDAADPDEPLGLLRDLERGHRDVACRGPLDERAAPHRERCPRAVGRLPGARADSVRLALGLGDAPARDRDLLLGRRSLCGGMLPLPAPGHAPRGARDHADGDRPRHGERDYGVPSLHALSPS